MKKIQPQMNADERRYRKVAVLSAFICVYLRFHSFAFAETGRDAWLRYAHAASASTILDTARAELAQALPGRNVILRPNTPMAPDAFTIRTTGADITISAKTDRGILYGAFALIRRSTLGQPIDVSESPSTPIRWVNHWDNENGTIERGYGGASIFWDKGRARADLSRVSEYGRLLASVGINACTINSVNVNPGVLKPAFIEDAARIAAAFRPWGVEIGIAVDFGSPKSVGGLDTFDPLDPKVAAWWKKKIDEVYAAVPDLAGIVLKSDSEGRVGPSAYGRTHAEAANVLARALAPHHGLLFYRGFVYDHHMDWRNPKNDRARAAYDNFHPLDGKFLPNVIVQVKHGPIDFQVREPASPLFAAMTKTKQAIELQITQEYFGQGRHTVYLVPMWKEALDFAMPDKPVKKLINGFVGVSNVGMDDNWFGNHLSQANLYGFGRLAWNPDLTSQEISEEWTRLTFGADPVVNKVVNAIQLTSWRTYENYTGPLGLQTLTDIVGNHYSLSVEASERNGWGQWHFADDKGVGMERSAATGTGYIAQYPAKVAAMYESLESCPDELLLFMHHVPYTYKLHNGSTVIQYLYEAHYEGKSAVDGYVRDFKTLAGKIDAERYNAILKQLEFQDAQSEVWRDGVNNWFARASGIADASGRVGKHPARVEAESMTLDGYVVQDVRPWEAASGGKAIVCGSASCVATYKYAGAAGNYQIHVQYFDTNTGVAKFKLSAAGRTDEWSADDHIPSRRIDAGASSLHIMDKVALKPGDEIRIEGWPDRGDPAALDYIGIVRIP